MDQAAGKLPCRLFLQIGAVQTRARSCAFAQAALGGAAGRPYIACEGRTARITMRIIALSAAALALSATAAAASPASITVDVSPELQAKAARVYGVRDVDQLAAKLQKAVERQTARGGAFDGARIVLQLADAKPNRPTFKQMSDNPSLSFQSFGVGGAQIEGHAVLPSGQVVPLSYRDFETDIRTSRLTGTWGDAESAIDQFAHRLGRRELASR
jgi:hypothetical protein